VTARDGGNAVLSHNIESTPQSWLLDPLGGDFHLRPGQNGAQDRGAAVHDAGPDIDGRSRDYGAPDIGADKWSPPETGGSPAPAAAPTGGCACDCEACAGCAAAISRAASTLSARSARSSHFVARQSFSVTFRRGRRVRRITVVTRRFRRSRGGGFVVRYKARRKGAINGPGEPPSQRDAGRGEGRSRSRAGALRRRLSRVRPRL
jgi:hypothetical protein